MGRISKCRRYVIDTTILDSLSLGELGAGVQCFGEFGASGRARTMKINPTGIKPLIFLLKQSIDCKNFARAHTI